ncbi:30S ribosomal protein S6 [Senna tora]|uniref:30S ribosomal protein S6 n=1 Tax=Senna tora TaxID=362788 RepID=A0A834X499_9FABA|nr:30S ribosomal protein S6 [Senna tora]
MEAVLPTAYLSLSTPKMMIGNVITLNYTPPSIFASSSSSSSSFPFFAHNLCVGPKKSLSLILGASKKHNKEDTHSFVPKPDEATAFFPEAVLFKEKKVEEDGRVLPEFADAEEKQLYESLVLELESDKNVEQRRHYEAMYLIHEKYVDEVVAVNEKIQDFIREKKGRLWRLNDWGMRQLAFKIQKADYANYVLVNFEFDAKYINEFKALLDQDERIIRHLVIKTDEAFTEDYPPPPEYQALRGAADDYDDDEFDDEYDDDDDDDLDDGVIIIDDEEDDEVIMKGGGVDIFHLREPACKYAFKILTRKKDSSN